VGSSEGYIGGCWGWIEMVVGVGLRNGVGGIEVVFV
jgi:hypothetical protein